MNMPRPLVAIVAGFFTSVFLVMAYQMAFVIALVAHDPRYAEAPAGSLALPPSLAAVSLIADACCAVVGGIVTAWIAAESPRRCVSILAAIHFIGSLASVMTDPSPMYPAWLHATRAIINLLVLLVVGWVAERLTRRRQNRQGSAVDTTTTAPL